MKTYIGDCETDGLLDTATTVWCLCLIDDETEEEHVFTKDGWGGYKTLEEAAEMLSNSKLVFHNGLKFDRIVLNKFIPGCNIDLENMIDTLVLSRLAKFERENYGVKNKHSIENFGKMFGTFKQEHEDWTQISVAMIERCVSDTRIGRKAYKHILGELKGFSKFSVVLEHETQEVCRRIQENGFMLNYNGATELLATVDGKRNKIHCDLGKSKPRIPYIDREVAYKITKSGKLHSNTTKPLGDDAPYVVGDYSVVKYEEFNPGSRPQIAYQLKLLGWVPEKFTEPSKSHPKGQPKIDEDTLLEAAEIIPEAKDIEQYLMLCKRSSQISKWIELYNHKTGRVHGSINHIGARTHRASHAEPNFAQVPSVPHDKEGNVLWGEAGTYSAECRDVWTVPEGYKIVGVDAAAIQLVILAHAMGDEAFSNAVAFGDKKLGTDIHSINRNALRDIIEAELPQGSNYMPEDFSRDNAKTWIYAFLLGAGLGKLRYIMNLLSSSADVKSMYLSRFPKLGELIKALRSSVYLEGAIQNIDGRWFDCDNAHFSLSYVLQGVEQTIMKMALVKLQKWIDNALVPCRILAWVHDEFQSEVKDTEAPQEYWFTKTKKDGTEEVVKDWPNCYGNKVIKIIEEVGRELKLKCFLTGEMHVGRTWQESH